jgi:AraC-like DNA-binding protein
MLIAGNSMQRFQSNDIFIIGANQPHIFKSDPEYFDKDTKKLVHSISVFFNPQGFISPLFEIPEMRTVREFIKRTTNGMQAPVNYQKVIADYILKVKRNEAGFRLAGFIDLLQLMANLKDWRVLCNDSQLSTITDHDGLRMNDIYQYTMANFSEDIPIEKIASVACMTPPAFCRYFKIHTRKTYVTFLNEVRINEACKQIIHGDFGSLASIAYKNGFNSAVTFNRVFKRCTGKSPREYMSEYTKNVEIKT